MDEIPRAQIVRLSLKFNAIIVTITPPSSTGRKETQLFSVR